MKKRIVSLLLTAAVLVGFLPTGLVTPAYAAEDEKTPIDQSTYEALGFTTTLGSKDEDRADSPYLGVNAGRTTMNTKNELYLDYQAHKNYGWVLRDNLNFSHTDWNGYESIGAYKLYGQYRQGDYDHLNAGNGYTDGQLGGTMLGKGITSSGSHKNRAYKTAVEFQSSSGKKDMVAQLYVTSGSKRTDWVAKLELLKYNASNGGYSPSVTSTVTLGAAPALDESGMIFQQYFDALYDITAGDFDGDGIDEIAVYFGTNEVRIYDTGSTGTSLRWSDTITQSEILKDTTISGEYDSDSSGKVQRAAIVTLVAGDLKKDFSDDLVVTVSMPQGSTGNAHRENPYAYIYGYDGAAGSSAIDYLKQDFEIPLTTDNLKGDTNIPQVFKTANAAIGDIDGDSCVELIIGGRLCRTKDEDVNETEWNVGALLPVEYNHSTKSYSAATATQMELKEYDEGSVLIKDGIDSQTIRYRAPVGMAVADLDGTGGNAPYTFFFSDLFTYDPDNHSFASTGMYLDTIKNQKNNVDESEDKGQHWVSDVVVGNFNNNENGAEQIIAIVACKESGNTSTDDDWYWYYMSYIAQETETKDGKVLVKPNGTICRQCEGIINQGRSYINRSDKSRASSFVSIACPDVDNDGILLEHIGTEAFYTKPEVQAVLQSSPYFADVAEIYDNYMNDASTAYANSEGSGSGAQTSIEASLGVYVETEVQLGGAAQFESEVNLTTSYDHVSMSEVETSVEYEGLVGDDYVVMYTVPHLRYFYNATFPDGETGVMTIEEPLTPSTVIVPVETYDAIAASTEGLEPIRGNILTSEPGNPATYTTPPKGKWQPIGEVQALTNAGGNSGSIVTVTQTASNSEENSFSVGIEESLKVGAGAGFLGEKAIAGVTQSFAINAGGVFSQMTGTEYSGSVDNLPAGVAGYGFNWQFGISKTKLNGEDIIVVGYQTSNVKRAPSLPQDISIAAVTSNAITLEWGIASDSAMYEVFVSGDQNEWLPLEAVPVTYATEDGKIYYTVKGLSSGNVYYFRVNSCDAHGIRSLETNPVSAQTLSENSTITILSQPKDTSAALSKDAVFQINAQGDGVSTMYYQWFRRDLNPEGKGYSAWTAISTSDSRHAGATSSVLTVKGVTMDDQQAQFRCRVSQSANYLYSSDAMLSVSKSPTETTLALAVGDTAIGNGGSVEAASTTVTDITKSVTTWEEVETNGYAKLAAGETETEVTNGEEITYSYTYTEPYVWTRDGKYYADSNGTTEYPVKQVFLNGEERIVTEGDKVDFSPAVTLPTAYEAGSDTIKSSVSASYGFSISGTGQYVYAVETAVAGSTEGKGEAASVRTTYYAATGTHTYQVTEGEGENATTVLKTADVYSEVALNGEGSYITVNGIDYPVQSLAHVKEEKTYTVVVGQTVQENEGDTLTLTAIVSPDDITGKVNFYIENTATGVIVTVPASPDNGTWTANHTFGSGDAGIYRITASYGGDSTYFSSRSAETLIYVTTASKALNVEGGSMTYGQSFALNPTLFHKDGSTKLTSGVAYSVTKDGSPVTGMITGNSFLPASAGTYSITATYSDGSASYTTTSNIVVSRRTVTITAPDLMLDVSMSTGERKAAVDALKVALSNVLTDDKAALKDCITLRSIAATEEYTINAPGEYAIEAAVTANADLESKYSFVTVPGLLTLSQDTKTVTATAGANGAVRISYTTTVSDSNGTYTSSPLTVESGSLLPVGASVTVTASPNSGFGVDKWVVDGTIINGTANEYTFTLAEATTIDVYFAYTYSTLNFSSEGMGALSGAYQGSSAVFNSGDSINANQTVILTAAPEEGHVVSYWTRDGEVVRAENGVDNYTGASITVTGVGSTTTYKVYFEPEATATVTVKFIRQLADGQQEDVLGCGVNFNGQAAESSTNTFQFETAKHNNVTITVDIPGNMLVDYWEKDGKVVANAVEELSIYDLSGDVEYTVYCETPNERILTFSAELVDTNGGALAEAGTLSAAHNGAELVSGATLPQGAVVSFTATAADGYRIAKWEVGGVTVDSVSELTISDNTSVKVFFEKKPVVTIDNGLGGTANGFVGGSAMGAYVEFGDDVQIDVAPETGYVIDTVKVNGEDVMAKLVTPSGDPTDKRYYLIDDVNANTSVAITYRQLDSISIAFGVVDKNDAAEGGQNGTITASVDRKGIAAYTVTDNSTGTLSPVYEGSTVTFTVSPETGYKVSKWFVNGEEVSEQPTLTITGGMADQQVMVQFDLVGEEITYAITGQTDKAALSATFTPKGGTTAESFASGNRPTTNGVVTFTVSSLADGYEIEGWYVDGVKQAGESTATFLYNAVADMGAEITVQVIRSSYEVSFEAANGTVTAAAGESAIASGDRIVGDTEVTFAAAPEAATGYTFKGWTVNGKTSDVTDETLTLTVTEDIAVKAVYELDSVRYTVTYGVIDTNGDAEGGLNGTLRLGGYTSSPASVRAGSDLTFTAAPASGYRVAGWYSDAEGTTEIDGTEVEQLTCRTTNLVADMTVYVKFEPIPAYTIDLAVEGLGAVTATVNGKNAAFADGVLTVQRYDDVVLTAAPNEHQYLVGWTVNGEDKGNSLILALDDVTENISVKAAFAASQNIELKTVINTADGSIKVQAGFDEDSAVINPTTGIIINKGQNVELTVTPADGKMVKAWSINGVEMVNYLDHVYVIEAIREDTLVEVTFEDQKFFSVPAGTEQYTITGIVETPVDLGGETQVRDRGTVAFKVVPTVPNVITEMTVNGGEGSTSRAVLNRDGSWTVTVENVKSDIVFDSITVIGGKQLIVNCGEGGCVTVTLNGETISSGRALSVGDVITVKATPDSGYTLSELTVNGQRFTSGRTYTVLEADASVSINAAFAQRPAGGGGGGGGGGISAAGEIVIEQPVNGEITTKPSNQADAGQTVVITAKPNAGFLTGSVTVTDEDGDKLPVIQREDGTYEFKMPSGDVRVKVNFIADFTDVSDGDYYADAVAWAYEQGITAGISATSFGPALPCTRAQMATFLWRAAGSPEPVGSSNPFADVSEDAYYAKAVQWALEQGITVGTSATTFSPDAPCTRAQMATFLYRNEQANGGGFTGAWMFRLPFTDVPEWAFEPIAWCYKEGITAGTSATTFSPDAPCTRAQMVTFLYRYFGK